MLVSIYEWYYRLELNTYPPSLLWNTIWYSVTFTCCSYWDTTICITYFSFPFGKPDHLTYFPSQWVTFWFLHPRDDLYLLHLILQVSNVLVIVVTIAYFKSATLRNFQNCFVLVSFSGPTFNDLSNIWKYNPLPISPKNSMILIVSISSSWSAVSEVSLLAF